MNTTTFESLNRCRFLIRAVGLRDIVASLVFLTFQLYLLSAANGHDFEDGHIERSITLVAHDDKVVVEYGLGCSENTMHDLIARWSQPENAAGADAHEAAPVPSNDNAPDGQRNEPDPDAGSTDSEPLHLETENSEIAGDETGPAPVPESPMEAGDETDESVVEAETRLREAFAAAVSGFISRNIDAECNGVSAELVVISAEQSSRHHVDVLVTFEFDLFPETEDGYVEDSGPVELTFRDRNFEQMTGAVRTALKVRGRTFLKQSETAPSLTRAERIELEGLEQTESLEAASVTGILEVLPRR
ncbi:MAG: hypothetical protein AAF456_23660 [Planctomycetota bacterium]